MSGKRSGTGMRSLKKQQLKACRQKLAERREELERALGLEVGSCGGEPETGDNCLKEAQVSLSLQNRERLAMELRAVESALRRIEHNKFGVCQACEEPIGEKRLLIVPTATHCISCQCELEERAKKRGLVFNQT